MSALNSQAMHYGLTSLPHSLTSGNPKGRKETLEKVGSVTGSESIFLSLQIVEHYLHFMGRVI